MIGVLCGKVECTAIDEFFQLFKTPWEYYRAGISYDVIVCCGVTSSGYSADLIIVCGDERLSFDDENGILLGSQSTGFVCTDSGRLPVYGARSTLAGSGIPILHDERTSEPSGLIIAAGAQTFVRLGFDPFQEIQYLLTQGQPSVNATIPVVELHIAFLRDLIVSYCRYLVEIPPVPAGFSCTVCLTHDVDHVAIRNHKGDHSMFGFLYRAVIGSALIVCRGRRSLKYAATNWIAVLSLPLVYLGLARDTWDRFERYLEVEKGLTSTFFFIPTKGDPGKDKEGGKPFKRAAAYDLSKLTPLLRRLLGEDREIGLHGIDAWRDENKAQAELHRIKSATAATAIGVRMHWLFFGERSPAILDEAGFIYDSTVGYNDVIGYRAGTAQVYKFPGVDHLLELPLHVMDTALFFPAHMNLSLEEAEAALAPLLENVNRFGGVLTINWHDRSLAPERLWDGTYIGLIEELKNRDAWFATCMQAVSWFGQRRATSISVTPQEGDTLCVAISVPDCDRMLPGFRLRLHKGRKAGLAQAGVERQYTDIPFDSSRELVVAV